MRLAGHKWGIFFGCEVVHFVLAGKDPAPTSRPSPSSLEGAGRKGSAEQPFSAVLMIADGCTPAHAAAAVP